MTPLAIRACTATSAVGAGRAALASALREGRSGLRRNDFGRDRLDCWIGRVEGLEQAPLPPELAEWESRNHRLAWHALHQDGFLDEVRGAVARHGATRVVVHDHVRVVADSGAAQELGEALELGQGMATGLAGDDGAREIALQVSVGRARQV